MKKTYSTKEAAEILKLKPCRITQICRWNGYGRKNARGDWFLSAGDVRALRNPENRKKKSE